MCKGDLDGTHFKNGGCPVGGVNLYENHQGVPLEYLSSPARRSMRNPKLTAAW